MDISKVLKDNLKSDNTKKVDTTRRVFTVAAAASALLPWQLVRAGVSQKIVYPDRSLSLYNVHTAEKEHIVYWSDGKYIQSGLDKINWIMRDFRTSDIKSIDPRLLNIVYLLTRKLESEKPIQLLSGFRSKKTNDMLRKTTEGVARRSFHMTGRAMDIRIPGIQTRNIQKAALRLGGGGVGFYPSSNFVHLDSGPVRTW